MGVARINASGHSIEVACSDRFREKVEPFFWPLIGDYPLYDRYIYEVMLGDRERFAAYQQAVEKLAPGKCVVEIGSGDRAVWARACARAGARRVYALEQSPDACLKAEKRIQEEGLEGVISILCGRSEELEIPEKADLSVSELIGEIGGSEGVAAILNDVRRRFLKEGALSLPSRCRSMMVPVQLPDSLAEVPVIERMGIRYVKQIFEIARGPFDLRLSVDNCFEELKAGMLSDPEVLEDLEFNGYCEEQWSREMTFSVGRAGRLDGILIWIELECARGIEPLSSLKEGSNWRPVFVPFFHPGIEVAPGNEVFLIWKTHVPAGETHPDYLIDLSVRGRGGDQIEASASLKLPRYGGQEAFRQNGFYRKLFRLA